SATRCWARISPALPAWCGPTPCRRWRASRSGASATSCTPRAGACWGLARLTGVIDKLVVYPDTMRANLDRLGGLVHSQRVLLALTQKGMGREDAYAAVQRNAMKVWRGEGKFLDLLAHDPDIRPHLGESELNELFDLGYHYKNVEHI